MEGVNARARDDEERERDEEPSGNEHERTPPRRFARRERDPNVELEQLDKAGTTKERISVAAMLHPTGDAPAAAEQHVAPYFEAWNAATHGQPWTSPADIAEVRAARRACKALAP